MIRAMSLLSTEAIDWRVGEPSVWVDVACPTPEEVAALREVFALNGLALDDALTHGQWSRFEAYPEHVFLVFRTLGAPRADADATERVSMFWYPATDTLLTVRLRDVEYLERTWREFDGLRHGSEERLIYTLLSQGTETFFEFADDVEARTDELEEGMFVGVSHPVDSHELTRRVFEARHEIMDVRRLVNNARASVSAFARHARVVTAGYANGLDRGQVRLDPQAQEVALYFRDVVDSLDRVYDTLDSAREVLPSVMDASLTVQSNRMNEVMKTLTVVSAIFLPLTFLAGVWGMNFARMPELGWRYGYVVAWSSFVIVAVSLGWYFKRRGWW
ncbi:magnesium transporter CorA family protein [Deinococcus pimensis]|uniref:magnesium transporter CorA family protein n=1 Tax=Deinococcus pimensis TaxID=309888 RepID=UPI000483726E|nr:magnesium transporter CorA family protein [Deinococcus pimensis]